MLFVLTRHKIQNLTKINLLSPNVHLALEIHHQFSETKYSISKSECDIFLLFAHVGYCRRFSIVSLVRLVTYVK